MSDPEFNFDLERMKEALKGPFVTFPGGLTREQRRTMVRDSLKVLNDAYGPNVSFDIKLLPEEN